MGCLLKTQWRVVRTRLLACGLVCLGSFAVLSALPSWGTGGLALPLSSLLCTYFYVMQVFESGFKNEAPILLLTMPFTRTDITLSRYLLGALYLGAFTLLTLVPGLALWAAGLFAIEMWLWGLGFSLGPCGLFFAVMMPLFSRFGHIQARNIQLVAFFALGIGMLLLAKVNPGRAMWLAGGGHMQPGAVWGLAVLAAGLIGVGVSYRLSRAIMEKKQF